MVEKNGGNLLSKLFSHYGPRHVLSVGVVVFTGGMMWKGIDTDLITVADKTEKNTAAIETLREDYGTIKQSQGVTQQKIKGLTDAIEKKDRNDTEHRRNLQNSINSLIDTVNRRRQPGGGAR